MSQCFALLTIKRAIEIALFLLNRNFQLLSTRILSKRP
jgi:hypothetical protein